MGRLESCKCLSPRWAISRPRPTCSTAAPGSIGPKARTSASQFIQTGTHGNILYCAFTRMFVRPERAFPVESPRPGHAALDLAGYNGDSSSAENFRDLVPDSSHFPTLGCRILHFAPGKSHPRRTGDWPLSAARTPRLDLKALIPRWWSSISESTGIDQFRELSMRSAPGGGRVFLDIVIKPHGWGSSCRRTGPSGSCARDGRFASRAPGVSRGNWSSSNTTTSPVG